MVSGTSSAARTSALNNGASRTQGLIGPVHEESSSSLLPELETCTVAVVTRKSAIVLGATRDLVRPHAPFPQSGSGCSLMLR